MNKKIIGISSVISLIVIMLTIMFCLNIITVSADTELSAGDTVEFTVVVSNNPDVGGIQGDLNYNASYAEYVSYSTFISNSERVAVNPVSDGYIAWSAILSLTGYDCTEATDIITVSFKVLQACSYSDLGIVSDVTEICTGTAEIYSNPAQYVKTTYDVINNGDNSSDSDSTSNSDSDTYTNTDTNTTNPTNSSNPSDLDETQDNLSSDTDSSNKATSSDTDTDSTSGSDPDSTATGDTAVSSSSSKTASTSSSTTSTVKTAGTVAVISLVVILIAAGVLFIFFKKKSII